MSEPLVTVPAPPGPQATVQSTSSAAALASDAHAPAAAQAITRADAADQVTLQQALRWFALSWIQAFSADGDGLPNWFWPAAQTGTFLGMEWIGALRYAKGFAEFVILQAVVLSAFCVGNIALWLGYKGWKFTRATKASQ